MGDSDILTVSPASPDESSPKQSLWVHTKATPPTAPKAPKKRRAWIPIMAASGALALLCVGIAWGVPRMHAVRPQPTPSASASVAPDDDADADTDGGDDEADDEVDAASSLAPVIKPQSTAAGSHTATGTHPKPKPKGKKKHH